METHNVDCLLKRGSVFALVAVILILMFTVAYQQRQIVLLDDRAKAHDEFIKFMQQGERFTYTDGKALFLLATEGRYVPQETKNKVWELYKSGDTSFSSWLRMQDVCKDEFNK